MSQWTHVNPSVRFHGLFNKDVIFEIKSKKE